MSQDNKNYIEINKHIEGKERVMEFINEPLHNSTFMPQTVLYEDIDKSFKDWAESLTIISDDGKEFPTFTLYSNQRFSEYMQSWQYVDSNNNLLLNFKTVSRDNNPRYGKIQGGYYNIPKDIFFTMKKQVVLDDNGSESLLKLEMRQPTAIDIEYSLSIFATKFQHLNEFNELINRLFNARQVYISPNGYYMSMTLEDISDNSQYNIDDRQFYTQIYKIKVAGFILTEDDFRYTEVPIKSGVSMKDLHRSSDKYEIEIEEMEDGSAEITIQIPSNCSNSIKFISDVDFTCDNIFLTNILNSYRIYINSDEVKKNFPLEIKTDDEVKFIIKKRRDVQSAKILLKGTVK